MKKNQCFTLEEFEEANKERLSIINTEFEAGFRFLACYPRSVTVFGSARSKEDNPYYDHAYKLSKRIAEELKYAIITGGGPGIMEAANRGAKEGGGDSLGMTISLPHEQVTNKYLTDHIDLYYFFSRKVCLSFAAEAYVFYPGGLGTLDEFFEIFTLVQTKKIVEVPIILVGNEYWGDLNSLITKNLTEKFKTIDKDDTKLFTITEDFDEIIKIIKKAPIREGLNLEHHLQKKSVKE